MRAGMWILLFMIATVALALLAKARWLKIGAFTAAAALFLALVSYCLSPADVKTFGGDWNPKENGFMLLWRFPWESRWHLGPKLRP